MNKWSTPQDVDQVSMVFGQIDGLLPPMEDIPEEFKRYRGSNWNKLVGEWFFAGIDSKVFIAKDGINKQLALRHLGTCMSSWNPMHEHKVAGCAYLMSLWFEEVK